MVALHPSEIAVEGGRLRVGGSIERRAENLHAALPCACPGAGARTAQTRKVREVRMEEASLQSHQFFCVEIYRISFLVDARIEEISRTVAYAEMKKHRRPQCVVIVEPVKRRRGERTSVRGQRIRQAISHPEGRREGGSGVG